MSKHADDERGATNPTIGTNGGGSTAEQRAMSRDAQRRRRTRREQQRRHAPDAAHGACFEVQRVRRRFACAVRRVHRAALKRCGRRGGGSNSPLPAPNEADQRRESSAQACCRPLRWLRAGVIAATRQRHADDAPATIVSRCAKRASSDAASSAAPAVAPLSASRRCSPSASALLLLAPTLSPLPLLCSLAFEPSSPPLLVLCSLSLPSPSSSLLSLLLLWVRLLIGTSRPLLLATLPSFSPPAVTPPGVNSAAIDSATSRFDKLCARHVSTQDRRRCVATHRWSRRQAHRRAGRRQHLQLRRTKASL